MNLIGFSTGALAFSDFEKALEIDAPLPTNAVELSALRDTELPGLLERLPRLNLSKFRYVSIHAPSRFNLLSETEVIARLLPLAKSGFPIIVHPDSIIEFDRWTALGKNLCIENMDGRKPFGNTVEQLRAVFRQLPEASFCLDLAHAWRLDPTLANAWDMLREFGTRLREVHISELDAQCAHCPLTQSVAATYKTLFDTMPVDVPFIIESVVAPRLVAAELTTVRWTLESPSHRRVAVNHP